MVLADDGGLEVNEQDTTSEVAQNVAAILSTPQGSRPMRPGFGLADTTHQLVPASGSNALDAITTQLAEYEPRAEYHAAADGEAIDEFIDRVTVEIEGVRANG